MSDSWENLAYQMQLIEAYCEQVEQSGVGWHPKFQEVSAPILRLQNRISDEAFGAFLDCAVDALA